MVLWVSAMVLKSRWRGRLAVVALLSAPLLWAALPPSLQNRFETIIHPEVGPANAAVSGQARLEGIRIGLELWGQYPATGCGPGAWKLASGSLIESHNLYGQLVGETGTLGALAFVAVLAGFWINIRWIRKAYRNNPEWGQDFLYYTSGAIGWGVLLMLFEGNFGHNLFRFSWLWYGGFLIIARYCVEQRLSAAAVWHYQGAGYYPGYGYGYAWPANTSGGYGY
jgi:hypothetical protein